MQRHRFQRGFWLATIFSVALILLGFLAEPFSQITKGLAIIAVQQDTLITDYMAVAGLGATLVNAGLVGLLSVGLLVLSKEPFNGFTVVILALMIGFALFGKNAWNIFPMVLGTWLYATYQQEPFVKYLPVALMATALSPLVSYMAFGGVYASLPVGILTGVVIGFLMPSISAYTFKIQNGMNLYNMGFACGLFAMMIVPTLTALGDRPDTSLHWSTEYHNVLLFGMLIFCVICIGYGLFGTKQTSSQVATSFRQLLATTGRAPSDFLRMFGSGAVLVNMGINGLLATLYILAIDGNLNGPTVGGIMTIMGFSAFGKHPRNILPIMIGVALGSLSMHHPMNLPALQLAGLFGTTLAPISGVFGWPFGILAGYIHGSLVLETAGPVSGVNLYNNGFSGGLIAIVLYPVLTAIIRRRRPVLQEKEYYDLFDDDDPISLTATGTQMHHMARGEFVLFYQLLEEGLPTSQFRTLEAQKALLDNPHYQVFLCKNGEKILGAMALWQLGQWHYIEHFVVTRNSRGRGIGAFMMEWCLHHFGGHFVLGIEPPNNVMSKRRLKFYEDLKFHSNPMDYTQPSLREGEPAVPLCLMSHPTLLTEQEFQRIHHKIYTVSYGISQEKSV